MKRTLISGVIEDIPREFLKLIAGGDFYDSSCSPEARVYYIDKGRGFFLKRAKRGSLQREVEMTKYFHSMGLATEILGYESGEYDWLLSAKMHGEDLTHSRYLSEPKRLAVRLGEELRRLHDIKPTLCPITDRVSEYLALAERNFIAGCYDKSHFPDSFGYASAEDAWRVLTEGRALLKSDVLIHGDYCLPNVIFNGWDFAGFIDLGAAGIGDRHIDLFWGAWTLMFNLGTDEYRELFFDAYGRDKIDRDTISVVAAAEVFG